MPLSLQALLHPKPTTPHDPGSVARMEKLLCTHYDRSFAVSVGDMHNAMLALGMAMELGHNDEVIVSPIEERGLVPLSLFGVTLVPAALRYSDLLISDEHLAASLSHRSRMVLVPHTAGLEPDYEALQRATANHGGPVMVALAGLGTTAHDGHPSAAQAEVLVVDLGPQRAITACQGAMILLENYDLFGRLLRAVAPEARQRAEGLPHPNAVNLNCPLPTAAAQFLERTWEEQWDQLTDRITQICASLRGHAGSFHTAPFATPGRCSFEDPLLCLADGATTSLERQRLQYFCGLPGRFRPKLSWRVPDDVNELLGSLAGEHQHYRLEDILRKHWPCY